MSPRVIFVTGATGFLGGAFVRLATSRGHRVHAILREGTRTTHLDDLPIRWHPGNLLDAASLDRALAAARQDAAGELPWVVHSAAVISYRTRDRELQRRVNVEGTCSLLDAAERHRVGRFLHVSSVVAVGAAPDGRTDLDEDSPFEGHRLRADYVDTKRSAEELALDACDRLDLCVVNPGAVFGPSPRESNTARFLEMIANGKAGPAIPPGSLSLVGVDDVAHGMLLALERGRRGRRYILTESILSVAEVFARAEAELGVRARRLPLPSWLWSAACVGAGLWDRFFPAEIATPQSLRLMGAHFRCSGERARRELGWQPQPFDQVLRATIDGLRSQGRLK